jgi:hypothetical protein
MRILHTTVAVAAAGASLAWGLAQAAVPAAASGTVPGPWGCFGAPIVTPAASGLNLATADLRHNGVLDLVASLNGQLVVLLGNPASPGTFGTPQYFSGGGGDLQIGDVDGDGHADIVWTIPNGAQSAVAISYGDGSGGFASPPQIIPASAGFIGLGDFNSHGDGRLDIVTSGTVPATYPYTELINQGNRTFVPKTIQLPFGFGIQVADINADGHLDFVVGRPASFGGVTVELGNGDGTFRAVSLRIGGFATALVANIAGDVQRNRGQDIVLIDGTDINVLLNQPCIDGQQYSLAGSDGTTWQPIDAANLTATFTPTADSAFVQTVIPVLGSVQYTAQLVWKSNKATTGTIYAAAGNGPYSPTRLTAELVPTTSLNLQTMATNAQYWLAGSDGSTWQDMDRTGGLTIASFTPAVSGSALVSANADLWTATGGVNQDIGIFVSGGTFGSGGTIVGWKESGGFAGTYSPNAAYAQSVIQLVGGTPYTIKVQWKANKNTTGTIFTAAGGAGNYSPTRLTLRMFPAGTGLQDAVANAQYFKAGSTGADWTPIDSTNLKLTVTPTANSLYVLSANADLWTATAGVNQDMGIFISGGAYGSGVLVAWKESGGFAGTFSPNAAFVQTVVPLAMGVSYTITLEWKANIATTYGVIYAGAGGAGNYSPTRITAQLMS